MAKEIVKKKTTWQQVSKIGYVIPSPGTSRVKSDFKFERCNHWSIKIFGVFQQRHFWAGDNHVAIDFREIRKLIWIKFSNNECVESKKKRIEAQFNNFM